MCIYIYVHIYIYIHIPTRPVSCPVEVWLPSLLAAAAALRGAPERRSNIGGARGHPGTMSRAGPGPKRGNVRLLCSGCRVFKAYRVFRFLRVPVVWGSVLLQVV